MDAGCPPIMGEPCGIPIMGEPCGIPIMGIICCGGIPIMGIICCGGIPIIGTPDCVGMGPIIGPIMGEPGGGIPIMPGPPNCWTKGGGGGMLE